ncbi:molybdopterin synthase catalytic subunit MoaE [Pleionea sp. CnH1-48]|uniref:molybdopterin synthase catalytic subunit MoaE n=1 Tax=Pleionea sp. CnH1-48 TaxID=2954494 RepID=UPI003530B7AF
MSQPYILVDEKLFDIAAETDALYQDNPTDGAVVTFIGLVRDFNQGKNIKQLTLEHYPAMTQKVLADIVEQANQQWSLGRVRVIHRVGDLAINDPIVFVGVSAMHRADAFMAAQFIMDLLKTQAPFWKKEQSKEGEHWVEARASDQTAAQKWLAK